MTTSGQPCKRPVATGLNVCKSHGGGTAASVRKSSKTKVAAKAAQLWGLSTDTSSLSIEEELTKLARNKLADIVALRLKISQEQAKHIGLQKVSIEHTEKEIGDDVYIDKKTRHQAGTSPWVQELHRAEQEFIQIARLLHEVSGPGESEQNSTRTRLQVAREAARLMKGFPGMSVEDVAMEVGKHA